MITLFDEIEKPTLVIDEPRVRANIHRMIQKANQQNIRFRPHFKTHQSAEIGNWFREEGVLGITVSSLDMAQYFARAGWTDITVAFPVNLRQLADIQVLASKIRLGVLVESAETVEALGKALKSPLDIWIKVDTGSGRTGLAWDDVAAVKPLLQQLRKTPKLHLRGLLTHAGYTYRAGSVEAICDRYHESVQRINSLAQKLNPFLTQKLEVSVGDTPGCTLCDDLGKVDEIRPGNFVFYDASQLSFGVCTAEKIAAAVVCPVVAKHPERDEVVIYGGGIHLSMDSFMSGEQRAYGLVCLPTETGWSAPLAGAYVRGLSQEHGILHVPPAAMELMQVGGIVCILPAHSCLTVDCMGEYRTLSGHRITTIHSCLSENARIS